MLACLQVVCCLYQLSKNDSSPPSEKKPFYIIPDPYLTLLALNRVVDSTGAGDTFNVVLAVRLAEGECLRDACIAANAAAAQSVAFKYVMPSVPRRPRLRLAK